MSIDQIATSLSPDFHLFRHGNRIFGVNQKSLRWISVPLTAVEMFELVDGHNEDEVRELWDGDFSEFQAFREMLVDVGAITGREKPKHLSNPHSRERAPHVRVLKLVEGCNLSCGYCYDSAISHVKKMPLELVRRTIDFIFNGSASDWIHIHFHGGEPLIHWEGLVEGLNYAISRADAKNIDVTFAVGTNGILLDRRRIEWLIENNVAVRISYDGSDERLGIVRKTHAGNSSLARVRHALDLICKYPEYREWTVLNTVSSRNVSNMLSNVLELQQMGVPAIQFQPIRFQGFASEQRDLAVNGSTYGEGLLAIAQAIVDRRIHSIRVQTILGLLDPLLTGRGAQGACGSSRCGAGDKVMAIDADGTIGACDTIPKGATRIIGHIDSGITSNFHTLIQRAAIDPTPECKTCPWLLACKGGCPGAAMSDCGSFFQRHQFACDQNLYVYPALLELLSQSDQLIDYFQLHSKSAPEGVLPVEALNATE